MPKNNDAAENPREDRTNQDALLAKTAKATFWVFIWRFFTRSIGTISTLILVRLLLPGDFGLVALGTGFAQAIDGLSILGVDDVLIREKNPERQLYDTAFTLNMIRNFATALIIAATAIPISLFFKDLRLTNILYALSLATIIEAFENVGVIDFRRQMAFEKEFYLRLLPRLSGTAVTITLAFLWRSYWALVVGIITFRILRVLMSYVMHPYRARLSISAWRHIIGFSVWTWFISLVVLVRDRTGSFVVGRLLGSAAVGIYSVAGEIATLPISEFVHPICRACWSAFAVARHTGENIGETYLRVIGVTMIIIIPAAFGIIVVAEPVVFLALGPHWMSAVPLLKIMSLGAMIGTFSIISGTVLSSHAVLKSMFKIITISYIIGAPIFVLLTMKYGLIVGSIGGISWNILESILMSWKLFSLYQVRMISFILYIWRPVVASLIMSLVLFETGFSHSVSEVSASQEIKALIVLIPTGIVSYISSVVVLWAISGKPKGAEYDVMSLVLPFATRIKAKTKARLAA